MNRLPMRAIVLTLSCAFGLHCFSQGTVNFSNGAAGVDAPVTNSSFVPFRRAGPESRAQLYVGPAGIANMWLLTTNGISGTPATFLSGGGAGYFLGSAREINGYPPGTTVTLQVRAWIAGAGDSWETAALRSAHGESNLIQITLGGGTIPTPNMIGLHGFNMTPSIIPEPSSFALATLGLLTSMILGLRRRLPRILIGSR
jgi:hypothetical protein